MRTYKYEIRKHPKNKHLGHLLDDMHEVHKYFHLWQRQRYKDGLLYANYHAMSAHLTELKKTTHPHWKSLPSQAIQCELKRIHKAYQRFFNKQGGRPHIKPKHKFKSITFPGVSGWQIEDNHITITFREWGELKRKWHFKRIAFTFHKHRDWKGDIQQITIKRDTCGDYWKPCILTDDTSTEPMPTTGESVGADNVKQRQIVPVAQFGMKDAYLTLSTGEKIQSPQFLKQSLKQLRMLNKNLSRKKKGSNNWWRAVRELAILYRKVSRQRLDWHWKLATDLCRRFDTLAFETLNIDGMKRLWGRKVSDLAFYQFVELLKYKCIKHKREFLQVGQWTETTTKPCSDCGHKNENLSLSDRQWRCPECGSHHDRDVNAAINILRGCLAPLVEQT